MHRQTLVTPRVAPLTARGFEDVDPIPMPRPDDDAIRRCHESQRKNATRPRPGLKLHRPRRAKRPPTSRRRTGATDSVGRRGDGSPTRPVWDCRTATPARPPGNHPSGRFEGSPDWRSQTGRVWDWFHLVQCPAIMNPSNLWG